MPTINEEIDNFKKQGYTEVQIRGYLAQKGYNPEQINQLLNPIVKNNHKKIIILITSIIAIILLIGILFILFNNSSNIEQIEGPSSWVKEENNNKIIQVEKVSDNNAFIDSQGQQIRYEEVRTVFTSYGYYKGNLFEFSYKDINNSLMRINTNMTPNDGIIESYVVFNIEEDIPVYYIFVDSDWKNNVNPTNIWWGFYQENKKEFNYTEISPGIYMDKIIDSPASFSNDYSIHLYKLFVGDMTEEKINNNMSQLTFIVVQ